MPLLRDANYKLKRVYKRRGLTNITPRAPGDRLKLTNGANRKVGQSHMAPRRQEFSLREAAKPFLDYGRRKTQISMKER